MNVNPLVSVVIPTHNRSHLVINAINSVLQQTYTNFECIVVDDASKDDTEKVVRSLNNDRIIYIKHSFNKHVSAARNTGIQKSKGELIAFLDDDDIWLPTKLEKQVTYFENVPESIGMLYCWMEFFNDEGKIVRKHNPKLKGNVFRYVLDSIGIGGCSSLIVRREVTENIGGFDEELPRGNDGDFIRRVCQNFEVDYVPEVLVKMFIAHGSERISDNSEKGLLNAILAEEIKFKKFGSELDIYPKQKSNIYSLIAVIHSMLGKLETRRKIIP